MKPEQVAAKFSEAYPVGDLDGLREVLHPDAAIWHNFDGREQSVEENLSMLAGIMAAHTLRYVDIRTRCCDGVVVQQHRVLIDEQSLIDEQAGCAVVEACLVMHIADGRITRLEEYFDPDQLAVLQSAVAPDSTPATG
jgi:ketosteroid isomerase-like protein